MASDDVTRIARRLEATSLFSSLRSVTRRTFGDELLAGATLVAIAVPEQLATAHLAQVPAFVAMVAFLVATMAFSMFGSNPILSVGADSTIAPLFAVALTRLALPATPHYQALVAATAVVAGVLVILLGLLQLGWLADFLSRPLVVGFMVGVGVTIVLHQLPDVLGVTAPAGSLVRRVGLLWSEARHAHGWPFLVAGLTLLLLVVAERWSPRAPAAVVALGLATVVVHVAGRHGLATLGVVHVHGPSFRLGGVRAGEWGSVVTTAVTIAVVIVSQSAATSRKVADDLGVRVSLNRDFLGLGVANVLSGLVGSIPVNASPARTGVVRLAGGRTQLVGLTAAAAALLLAPLSGLIADLPLASLAGVLLFVAGRLINLSALRAIARVDRWECALALGTTVAVLLLGVQDGLAVAVALAVADQTRRSARPHAVVLERERGTTSWRPARDGTERVDHVTVLLFGAPLFFANADRFRGAVHDALVSFSDTRHLVIDAASMVDVDYTGLETLSAVVTDLGREHVDVVIARANPSVARAIRRAPSAAVRDLATHDSVDDAVRAVTS